jgi:hypothetical protein
MHSPWSGRNSDAKISCGLMIIARCSLQSGLVAHCLAKVQVGVAHGLKFNKRTHRRVSD